jgi:hypothetical protein
MAFYVQQHNQVMPHWAFNGLTPDEVYFGKTDGVVESLAVGRVVGRAERLKTNQAAACPSCHARLPEPSEKSRQRSELSHPETVARMFAP